MSELLNTNIELTAACTLVGGMLGSSMFYKNDMNIHTAVFVDTLNTAIKRKYQTNWGNSLQMVIGVQLQSIELI